MLHVKALLDEKFAVDGNEFHIVLCWSVEWSEEWSSGWWMLRDCGENEELIMTMHTWVSTLRRTRDTDFTAAT